MKVHLAILICISFQVVLSEQVASCESDSECRVLNTCSNNECVHKELIPLESLDIVGGLVILVLAGLANAGGMGGGPLMTSSILLILSFETHQAIPLAQIIVAGGSFVAISLKFTQKHPKRNRPLINYTVLMHIQSPLLLGTTFGVILNRGFPEWLIIFLLTALLVFATFKTARKGIKLYKSESLNKVDQEEPGEEADGENDQLTAARELNNGSSVSSELQAIYDSEKKNYTAGSSCDHIQRAWVSHSEFAVERLHRGRGVHTGVLADYRRSSYFVSYIFNNYSETGCPGLSFEVRLRLRL
mmetsp:Transcript_16479/g.23882  ORF Transcript_16479/g.23882 Transcript_16479/m.23882 type:complete len:301 (-) Transcript_16479:1287-2189(-)